MNISKYLTNDKYLFGDIISLIINDLYKNYNYKNILFVRTYTTGHWLNNLLTNKQDVDRILYYTDDAKKPRLLHNSTIVTHSDNFEKKVRSLGKIYDLICFDTYHENKISSRDFSILSSLLNETGILISHDCYPWNKTVANPYFVRGNWCGETYMSFVEFAYNNPDMYYAIINIDTGIGIASKKDLQDFPYLSNKLNRDKQKYLLSMYENSLNYYEYFTSNSKEIINAIFP